MVCSTITRLFIESSYSFLGGNEGFVSVVGIMDPQDLSLNQVISCL